MTETTMQETAKYTLRPLEATDVFIMAKIIHAIGIKEFKECFKPDLMQKFQEQKSVEAAGMEVFFEIASVLTGNLPKCEKDIYTFLSNLSGMDKKQIEHLPMNVFLEMVIGVIRKEEFGDFLSAVSKLFK